MKVIKDRDMSTDKAFLLRQVEKQMTTDESLRLEACGPEMLKELEEAVIAIKDFQDNCEEAEHTDTNQVHQLLENIHCDFIKVIGKAKGEL